MSSRALSVRSGRRISPLLQFRFWQFGLLVALTAIAIVDIQGYCRAIYAVAIGGLFLAATVAYLVIEYFYLGGKLL